MAIRGRKPKPPDLRIIEGNPGKRSIDQGPDPAAAPADHVPLPKPRYIKGRAAKLWEEVATTCWWLGDADSYKLGMWCALQAEFERSPGNMVAARIAQLRALGSELGLDPGSRSRLGSMKGGRKKGGEEETPKAGNAKYFDR